MEAIEGAGVENAAAEDGADDAKAADTASVEGDEGPDVEGAAEEDGADDADAADAATLGADDEVEDDEEEMRS